MATGVGIRSTGLSIDVLGLKAWVVALKGPAFKDVNRALRAEAYQIAKSLEPEVEAAVRTSRAPQAQVMSKTVRAKSDRVPVLSIGAVNPRFSTPFTRRGTGNSRQRRGAIAHGVVYGTKGGRRPGGGDYYHIRRDNTGGPVGRYMLNGPAFDAATDAYFAAYRKILAEAGINLGRRAA
jgi:hypothetical protein